MNSNIGVFIAEKRKENQLTQKQLADKLSVTDKAVSKWERGAGYPDIMLLAPLAEALHVTVGELLQGEEAPQPEQTENAVVTHTLEYADMVVKKKIIDYSGIGKMIISAIFMIALVVCIICDLAINHAITWAVYPIASLVFAWLIIIPFFQFKTHRVLFSLASLTLFLLPFLLVINNATGGGWFFKPALPVALIALVFTWGCYGVFYHTKFSIWYKFSAFAFLSAGLTFGIDAILEKTLGIPQFRTDNIITLVSTLLVGFLLATIGFILNSRNKT